MSQGRLGACLYSLAVWVVVLCGWLCVCFVQPVGSRPTGLSCDCLSYRQVASCNLPDIAAAKWQLLVGEVVGMLGGAVPFL